MGTRLIKQVTAKDVHDQGIVTDVLVGAVSSESVVIKIISESSSTATYYTEQQARALRDAIDAALKAKPYVAPENLKYAVDKYGFSWECVDGQFSSKEIHRIFPNFDALVRSRGPIAPVIEMQVVKTETKVLPNVGAP